MNLTQYPTLVAAFEDRAAAAPEMRLITFLNEDGRIEHLTYRELLDQARSYAAAFGRLGAGPGDLVILVMNHALELLPAFWGALLAGVVPSIFPYQTEKLDADIYRQRVRRLVEGSGARFVVTFAAFQPALVELFAGMPITIVRADELAHLADRSATAAVPALDRDQTAFIQYSSGTTGLQKGVVLSHRAALNNIQAIARAVELRSDDVVVCWLPLHHDMGLITGMMLPILAGIPAVLLSPFQWVRDPSLLLKAVHRYHGTLCWMPNFAFNHCARSIRERDLEGLDLRHWRTLIDGGEPVRLDSLHLFAERFAPLGFREQALGAGYGMAEITGAVCITPMGRMPRVDWVSLRTLQEAQRAEPAPPEQPGATPIVSSGRLVEGVEAQIVGAGDTPLPERHIGEILVRSNAMLSGYHNRPDLTADAMRLGWHRTGDLGYLSQGDLFVTGRLKDLIISGGRNIYPEDIEALASTIDGVRPGRAVAFGLPDATLGTEAVVMVCELREEGKAEAQIAVERELRRRVTRHLDVALSEVRFVERGWVVKTPSGKVARAANREKYLRLPGRLTPSQED